MIANRRGAANAGLDELTLGCDVGSSNVKACLVRPDGHVVATATAPHATHHPQPGWTEQHPRDWWRGAVTATRAALEASGARPDQVLGIGTSGQGCPAVLVDRDGDVLRPAITATDTRSQAQCEQLRDPCGDQVFALNGKQLAPYNADPVLVWLRENEPNSLTAAQTSLTAGGWLNLRLTGEAVENISDASILFAFDLVERDWSDALVECFGLPRRLYPAVAACTEVVGGLTEEAADDLGLRPGTPVVAGGEDTSSAGLAIGVVQPGQVLVSLGTAGTIYGVRATYAARGALLAFLHVVEGLHLLGGSTVAAGAALDWCRRVLDRREEVASLARLAAESRPGAGGVLFLPYLSGELQPINDGHARGMFFGLSMDTGPPQLVRAVMEGVGFALAHNLGLIAEVQPVNELRAVGGPSSSTLWSQIIADIAGRPLTVLPDTEGAARGDALLAAQGIGLIDEVASVAKGATAPARVHEPNSACHEHYRELFEVYRQLYPVCRSQFAAMTAFTAREATRSTPARPASQ